MRKIIAGFCFFIIGAIHAQSKGNDVKGQSKIVLNSFVPDQIEGLIPIVKSTLENKLTQIAAANGVGGNDPLSRFILTANVSVLSKDITPTAPPMHQYTLEVTLYMGDGIEGTKFSSHAVTLKGAGINETKAYQTALKNLKSNDPQYKEFLKKGEAKIIEYYNSKCPVIIKNAQTLAVQGQYEEALYKLSCIPEDCRECFDKSMAALATIYKQQIDKEGKANLLNAKSAWSLSQDVSGAISAGEYLSQIDPDSSSYKEAKAFADVIAGKLAAAEKRDWDFKMKMYKDETDARKQTLEAAKAIGTAYAKNQPKTVYRVYGWW